MASLLPYSEENFGILTDDDLYLDCILVKPVNLKDENLRALRVWVPKYPLTKTSVITCARQEVRSYGPDGKVAHLIFDLRGTGDSEGSLGDENFQLDLQAITAWAGERFGKTNFAFLGYPTSEFGRVNLWPLRPGSMMETYYYLPSGNHPNPPCVLYLSTYGIFSRADDALCVGLAANGYHVYGLDPLRYLLHASVSSRLTPEDLYEDLRILIQMLPGEPMLITQPLASGLGLVWAAGVKRIKGVLAIGKAQAGLSQQHIFQNSNPYTYLVHRHAAKIAPRPVALIQHKNHPLGGDEDELAMLYQSSKAPHRLERPDQLTAEFLVSLLKWAQNP